MKLTSATYLSIFFLYNLQVNAQQWINYSIDNSGILENCITAITIDAQGNKWIGTNNNGVSKFDGTNWKNYTEHSIGNASGIWIDPIMSIAIDKNGVKWFGLPDGVSKLDNKDWKTWSSDYNVDVIKIDAQNNVWFGKTGSGVLKFDGTTWSSYTPHNCDILDSCILSIAFDPQGNKWFGTSKGISKFDGNKWTNYTLKDCDILENNILAIAIDLQNNKWLGTKNHGVIKFDGTTWINYTKTNCELADNNINAIAIDPNGNKWFGTNKGVSKFDGTKWTTFSKSNSGLSDDIIISMAIDSQNNIWFGTARNGVSELCNSNCNIKINEKKIHEKKNDSCAILKKLIKNGWFYGPGKGLFIDSIGIGNLYFKFPAFKKCFEQMTRMEIKSLFGNPTSFSGEHFIYNLSVPKSTPNMILQFYFIDNFVSSVSQNRQ